MNEAPYDWPAIFRVTGIVVGITAVAGLVVPILAAMAVGPWDTLKVSGNEIYRFGYWALAWGLLIWQGSWMLRAVHDRIVNDMLLTGGIVAVILLIVKFVVWFVYWPINSEGQRIFAITGIDAAGALITMVVALIAARVNRY